MDPGPGPLFQSHLLRALNSILGACLFFGTRASMTCALGPGRAQAHPRTQAILFGSKILKVEGLGFFKSVLRDVVASGGSKSLKIGGLELFKHLLRGVVASGGSKSSRSEGLGFVKPPLRGVVASS